MKLHVILFACLLVPGVAAANAEDDMQANIVGTYLKLANEGDTFAQYFIAHRYEIGKGVPLDLDKALFWYEKAASKGHPLARQKVAELRPPAPPAPKATAIKPEKTDPTPAKPAAARALAAAPPPAVKPAAKAPAPRASAPEKPSAPVAETKPSKPTEPQVVAKAAEPKAPPEPAAPSVDIMKAILGGSWSRAGRPAEFLPSANAACLQASASEIVCFSQELTRNAAGAGLTYAVKSTLSGFNDREGKFTMTYVYDVLRVASSPYTEAMIDNPAGDIAARAGWQEPGQRLECRLSDEKSLSCARADRAIGYQFVRN